jgi:hypothetical protein
MIANHAQFIAAIQEHKKVWLRFYSTADGSVLDRVCAPMDYGPGGGMQDGLNRYWLWDYASDSGSNTLGLLPKQIVELRVLGDLFDPADVTIGPALESAAPIGERSPASAVPAGGAAVPIL